MENMLIDGAVSPLLRRGLKRKVLLVGAGAGVEGPWVHLEKGTWKIDRLNDVIRIEHTSEQMMICGESVCLLDGPCRVRVIVQSDYVGLPIHLDVAMTESK